MIFLKDGERDESVDTIVYQMAIAGMILRKKMVWNSIIFIKSFWSNWKLQTISLVASIYQGAYTNIREPKYLTQLIDDINKLEWYGLEREDLGDMYEGLLEKNANETKSGAGQYFTPRVLINSMVKLMKPQAGERLYKIRQQVQQVSYCRLTITFVKRQMSISS